MAWNGFGGVAKSRNVKKKAALPIWRGFVAVIVVVCGVAMAYWCLSKPDASGSGKCETERKPGKIVDATPIPLHKSTAVETSEQPKKTRETFYWERSATNGLNAAQLRKWEVMHLPAPSFTNTAMRTRPKNEYEIFETKAENEIAMFMTMQPGDGLVGSPSYGDAFRDEFLMSCEAPIIIDEKKDGEYEKWLKREMNQIKIELRQRMHDGEDICAIMTETREEMMRLGLLKQQIEGEMRSILKNANSAEDFDDCINAANRLLEAQGVSPIRMNPIVRRNIMRQLGISAE